ncbi:LAFA_0A01068g1_1 [Lachancea sp. 'fantastica']|nr:LAFA_0A01068g1_1 [Lachancea sp. 'fantastica']
MNVSSLSLENSADLLSNSISASPDSSRSHDSDPSSPTGSTLSYDEYLKVATDTSASILMELNMDGRIRYISPIWEDIVGTKVDDVVGQAVSDILVGTEQDRSVFQRATDLMIREDCSYRVRFLVEAEHSENDSKIDSDVTTVSTTLEPNTIELEAQGVVISDATNNIPTHSMWIVKPFCEMGAMDNLPQDLVKRLGFGANIFSQFLAKVEESMVVDEEDLPTPMNELCRVCESLIPAWWLETHSESCIVEHKIESVVQLYHDKLAERKSYLEEMCVSLEANDGRITQYKGLPLPKPDDQLKRDEKSTSPIAHDLKVMSVSNKPADRSKIVTSTFQKLGFPFKALVSLITLCEDALNTNTSELKELRDEHDPQNGIDQCYEFSPRTEKNIRNVMEWRFQDDVSCPTIDLLQKDTTDLVLHKIENLFRLDNALKYSLKIKKEIDNYVLQLIKEKLDRNRLNVVPSPVIPQLRPGSPSMKRADADKKGGSSDEQIASPQPQRAQSEFFSEAYVNTDEIPRQHNLHNSDGNTENERRDSPRSITPKQPVPDNREGRSGSGNEHPKIFESVSGTPKLILPDSSGNQKFNGFHEYTPRRDSAASTAGHSTPLSSLQKNSIFRPMNSASLDRSPITSPYAVSSDRLTPELHSAFLPKQPLSPLLLATNQAKPSTPSIRDYDIIKPISKGAYGSVFLAKRRITGDYFAIKVLKKSDMIAKNQVTNVKSERAIMMIQSNKPYVAQLFATFQNRGNLFLVMEYLSGGDLATLIKMMGCLPDQWAKQYISEVIFGVADMHQSGIIHHDLKPDNLLIDRRGHLKLTDFGLSRLGLVTRHRGGDHKDGAKNSREGSTASEEGSNDFSTKWPFKNDSASSNNTLDAIIFKTERSGSNSSSQSIQEVPALRRSGSQLSFSMADSPGGGSPPPMNLHKRASSNISESWDNGSPTPDYTLFNPDDSRNDKRFFGTPDYLAPETIEGTGETDACDWWSVGCMLFEFYFGYPPFHAPTVEEVFSNILAGRIYWPEFPDEETELEFISLEAKDLIKKLLVVNPNERLGANDVQDIFQHPYFKDVDWESLYEETGSFVPDVAHPESTDYFDLRGAQLEDFSDSDTEPPKISELMTGEVERAPKRTSSERSSHSGTPVHKLTVGSVLESSSWDNHSNHSSPTAKQLPLAIPPHLRDRRVSKLNELQTEFGSFNFRNLPALDKANKDVINRLKNEHLVEQGIHHYHHHRTSSGSSSSSDFSNKLKHAKAGGMGNSLSNSVLSPRSSASPNASKNQSPSRRGSVEIAMTSRRRSAGGATESSLNFLNPASDNNDSPSPVSRFKSPLSPQHTSSRNRGHSHSSSKRPSLEETVSDGSGNVKTLSRAPSSHSRRHSDDKIPPDVSTLSYNLDVLVCEPIPIHRFKLTRDLESLGCSVISVSMGDEMVRRATSEVKFDLVFTALKLPKLGAIDIVKLLRNTTSFNRTTPIIAVTAFYQEAQQACVFDGVLERPVSIQHLRSLLLEYTLKKNQEADDTIISDADS